MKQRHIIIGISVIMVTILLLGFMAPKDINVRVQRTIEASNRTVYPRIADLDKQHEWNWIGRQSADWIYGRDEKGKIATWTGGSWMSTGTDRLLSTSVYEQVENEIRATTPWQKLGQSKILMSADDDGVEIDWTMRVVCPFPFNIGHLTGRPQARLESEMQTSLDRLTKDSEQAYLRARWDVHEVDVESWYCIDIPRDSQELIAAIGDSSLLFGAELWSPVHHDDDGNALQICSSVKKIFSATRGVGILDSSANNADIRVLECSPDTNYTLPLIQEIMSSAIIEQEPHRMAGLYSYFSMEESSSIGLFHPSKRFRLLFVKKK